jgi:hypothetical protein
MAKDTESLRSTVRSRHVGLTNSAFSWKFAWGLLDKVAWMRGGLITFNTNLSRFLARSHTSRVVISAQPDTEGGHGEGGTESIKMSTLASG